MHSCSLHNWEHSHSFGQEHPKEAEKYTIIVICITFLTMLLEIAAGLLFGSMALLADGIHMGTHTLALGESHRPGQTDADRRRPWAGQVAADPGYCCQSIKGVGMAAESFRLDRSGR